jgi:hypothetical protein
VRRSYEATITTTGEEEGGRDDGSSPREAGPEEDEEEVSLYISQQEWASGGLAIFSRQVQGGLASTK